MVSSTRKLITAPITKYVSEMIKMVSLKDVEKIAIDFISRKRNAQDITVSQLREKKVLGSSQVII